MVMVRNYFLIALFSFLVVYWNHFSLLLVNFIHSAFTAIANWGIFNLGGHEVGATPRHIIALTAIPILAGLVTYFIFWLLRKQPAGFIAGVTWCVWLVLATILIVK